MGGDFVGTGMAPVFAMIVVSTIACCVTVYLTNRSVGKMITHAKEGAVNSLSKTTEQAMVAVIEAIKTDGEQTRAAIMAVADVVKANGEATRSVVLAMVQKEPQGHSTESV